MPAELKNGLDTLYTEFCMEQKVFNPPIQSPTKKAPEMGQATTDLLLQAESRDLDMFTLISLVIIAEPCPAEL